MLCPMRYTLGNNTLVNALDWATNYQLLKIPLLITYFDLLALSQNQDELLFLDANEQDETEVSRNPFR